MNAVVVYESVYGNTRAVAEAIGQGLGGAEVVGVHEAPDRVHDADLLIVGGPTHVHGMTSVRTREAAVAAVDEQGTAHVEPRVADEPDLRTWIRDLPHRDGARAATFDTRADKPRWLTGAASRAIAKRLHRRGYEIVSTESFLVEDSEGPLEQGELERAREWGRSLARLLPAEAQRAIP